MWPELFSTYAQSSKSFLATVLMLPLLALFRYAYLDYQGWYALGAGGLPHNAFGWLVQSLLRLRASRSVRDSRCYDAAIGSIELEGTSFFDDQLPKWTGEAPRTAVWVAPHRQVEQVAGVRIKKALEAKLSHIVDSNPQYLELGPSKIEGGAPALFVSSENYSTSHANYPHSPREVFHSHCSAEGSSHAILSAADAKLVLDSGWGERHGVSGRALGFPLSYVMIFAPRSMAEVETVGMIARAAARYGLEGKKIH